MDNTISPLADFNHIIDMLLMFAVVGVCLFFAVRTIALLVYYLAIGDERWRIHWHNFLMTSDLYAAGYAIKKVGDAVYDKTQKRADVIDKAITEGKDPYKAVDDAGL